MPLSGKKSLESALAKSIDNVDKSTRAKVFQALSNIQKGTPVDTGRARANWFLTTNSPSINVTASVEGNEVSINELPKPILGKQVFFTNNLPYIERLEYDAWSKQAPAGWVRVEMIRLARSL